MFFLFSLTAVALFLAYANGANDNFKGVATLLGSGTANYRTALVWGTFTTGLGSLAAFFLAQKLITAFSGRGWIPDSLVGAPAFSLAVLFAAALTVWLATRLGFPISTTHALIGGLAGVGGAAIGAVGAHKLWSDFFLPLLTSPAISAGATAIVYPLFKVLRERLNVREETCLCIGNEVLAVVPAGTASGQVSARVEVQSLPTLAVDTQVHCEQRYFGRVLGIDAKRILDIGHFLSAGLTGFARGLNDTPKIAAVLIGAGALSSAQTFVLIAAFMALGGLLQARRVAETLAHKITQMNDGQGFTANLVTSGIVVLASHFGWPVSTTHVSCGALFGLGFVTGQAHGASIRLILAAWVVTLPVASSLGALSFYVLRNVM
jgi:PiT family inorganic phosphate transporter